MVKARGSSRMNRERREMEKGYVIGFITLSSRFESLFRNGRRIKGMKLENKVEYVREHYNKSVRRSILEALKEKNGEERERKGFQMKRKKQRVWTLNRSPHGNKTAREQFGRQVWQRRRERERTGRAKRKQRLYSQDQYVSRKERSVKDLKNV